MKDLTEDKKQEGISIDKHKKFTLHTEKWEMVQLLTEKQQADLLKALFLYNLEKDLPELDTNTELTFIAIKQQFEPEGVNPFLHILNIPENARNSGEDIANALGHKSLWKTIFCRAKKKKREDDFTPPTIEEVEAYFTEMIPLYGIDTLLKEFPSYNDPSIVDYKTFYELHTANNWKNIDGFYIASWKILIDEGIGNLCTQITEAQLRSEPRTTTDTSNLDEQTN